MKKNNAIILAVVLLVVGLVAGFFVGKVYEQKQQSTIARQFLGQGQMQNNQGNNSRTRQPGGNGTLLGNRPVTGEIVSSDAKSITVKLADGSTKIVLFSGTTGITKSEAGSSADLQSGTTVMVMGSTNSDGSVTAQSIQVNPVRVGQQR